MHFCGKNAEFLWKTLELRSGWMINSVKQPIIRSKTLVKFVTPVWEEGLFLFRCSVFFSVISGVCLLVWYGQSKAKLYVEANLLPSVCTLLSDHIQRDIDFGKVRRISPLSITLESCSIGPHSEEFSCGEVPTVKLRIRPFTSLRRGKFVIDAVLSNPSLLVAQNKNYSWLGIPYSEGIPKRHLSTEEGIDYRTRNRRIAREEAAMRWERERDDAARVSAEKGYIITECNCVLPEDDLSKESTSLPTRLGNPDPFLYMDEKFHWRDHHCMDAGAEYDLKHADLEKSFGAKIPTPETSIWSRIMPGSLRHKFKRKANGRDLSLVRNASKRRLLDRSASAARLYFQGESMGISGNSTKGSAGFDDQNLEISPTQSRDDVVASVSAVTNSEGDSRTGYEDVKLGYNGDTNKDVKVTGNVLTNKLISEVENKLKSDSVSRGNLEMQFTEQMNIRDPFLFTLARIIESTKPNDKFSSLSSLVGMRDTSDYCRNSKSLEGDDITKTDVKKEAIRLVEKVKNGHDDILDSQGAHASSSSSLTELESACSVKNRESLWPSSSQSSFSAAFIKFGEAWSSFLVNPLRRMKSGIGAGVEVISTELADEITEENTSGIDKMIPLVLDSVHFKGGTLMLLAYGDTEPRYFSCATTKSMSRFSFIATSNYLRNRSLDVSPLLFCAVSTMLLFVVLVDRTLVLIKK